MTTQLNGHKEFARVVVDNYDAMEEQLREVLSMNTELRTLNGSLTAEVRMLREALERSDGDRARLYGVAGTLSGQLLAINAVIADALQAAVRNGIDATKAPEPPAKTVQKADPELVFGTGRGPLDASAPPQVDWVSGARSAEQ